MKYLKWLLVLVVLSAAIWSVFSLVNAGPKVAVLDRPEYGERIYSLLDGEGKELSLTVYRSELDRGGLRLRSNSALPLDRQAALVDRLLGKVLREEKQTVFQTLFVGRLINAFGQDQTMSKRLALAAFRSTKWDKQQGWSLGGRANVPVKDLINEAMVYPELRQLFARRGLKIECAGVEKVLISTTRYTLPFLEELKGQGVKGSDQLPFDCLTWFSISAEAK